MNNSSPYIKQIRLIYISVLVAFLLFAFMMILIKPPAMVGPPTFSGFDTTETIISLVLLTLVVASFIIFNKMVSTPPLSPDKLRTAYIIRLALLEAGGILSLIMYLTHDNQIYLIYALVLFLIYFSLYPTTEKLKKLIDL